MSSFESHTNGPLIVVCVCVCVCLSFVCLTRQFYIPLIIQCVFSIGVFAFVVCKVTDAHSQFSMSDVTTQVYTRLGVQLSVMFFVFVPDMVVYMMTKFSSSEVPDDVYTWTGIQWKSGTCASGDDWLYPNVLTCCSLQLRCVSVCVCVRVCVCVCV